MDFDSDFLSRSGLVVEAGLGILHRPTPSEPFAVVFKPGGLPSAPLSEGDDSALTRVVGLFPEASSVVGRKGVERGLVHRIDTGTSGLVLVATDQAFFDCLQEAQSKGLFRKWYRAGVAPVGSLVETLGGFPPCPVVPSVGSEFSVESSFRPFGPKGGQVRPVSAFSGRAALRKGGGRLYSTSIKLVSESEAVCSITSGYRHQVRCHLAWCGIPVGNDPLYNPAFKERIPAGEDTSRRPFDFCAFRIEFPGFSFEF